MKTRNKMIFQGLQYFDKGLKPWMEVGHVAVNCPEQYVNSLSDCVLGYVYLTKHIEK